MQFKAKPFKLGNSMAVYIPKDVYTKLDMNKVYTLSIGANKEVYTLEATSKTPPPKKRASKLRWCTKHDSWKTTCKCK